MYLQVVHLCRWSSSIPIGYRSIRLPEVVEGDKAESTYVDGVLTVTMSRKPTTSSKKMTANVQ